MIGNYYKTIHRDENTGETEFLFSPEEKCSFAHKGLVKCKGIIGFYEEKMPLIINGRYDGEYFGLQKNTCRARQKRMLKSS